MLNMPGLKRSFSLSGCVACMVLLNWRRLLLLVVDDADMLPTRSLLLAASSESGSILFVLLSLLGGALLPFCRPAPFELLPWWALPFRAELDPACPDMYRWNLTGRLSLSPGWLPFLKAPLPTLPLAALRFPDAPSLAARDL